MSRRMGRFKPLLPFGDKPMVTRLIESLGAGGGISTILIVTGHNGERVREAVSRGTGFQPVRTASTSYKPVPRIAFVHNRDYENGEMLSSVQAGVRALEKDVDAFVLALGDQPAVAPKTVRLLLAAWRESRAPLVLPRYLDRRGHPIIIASECFPAILALKADQTLKTFVTARSNELIEVCVDDPAVVSDVDTPQDYEEALRLWESRPRETMTEGGAYARQ